MRILLLLAVISAITFTASTWASESATAILRRAIVFQRRYEDCEFGYFTEIASQQVSESDVDRFTGGFSGYESWQGNQRFLLASNEPLRKKEVTGKLRSQSILDLKSYDKVTLSNEKYQARVAREENGAYSKRGESVLGKFEVKAQYSMRYLFAPDYAEWIAQPEKLKTDNDAEFHKRKCRSVSIELQIPEDNPPSWERRTTYFDPATGKCLGHRIVYSDTEGFESPAATEEYVIEFGKDDFPSKITRDRTGKYQFQQLYEFTGFKLGKQPNERFFLSYYGIDEPFGSKTPVSFGTWMIIIGVGIFAIASLSKWIQSRNAK